MRVLMMSAVLLAALGPASAQNYPTKPITVIVPFAAGGPSDTIARLTVAGMGKVLGQQLIIENVGGAGGTIGSARAARADADGYTLFIHHLGLATSATLYRKLSYDTKTAFAPVGLVSDAASTFIARPDFGPNTFQEFVAYAKANGDKVSYGHAGVGSASGAVAGAGSFRLRRSRSSAHTKYPSPSGAMIPNATHCSPYDR